MSSLEEFWPIKVRAGRTGFALRVVKRGRGRCLSGAMTDASVFSVRRPMIRMLCLWSVLMGLEKSSGLGGAMPRR